MHRRLTSCVFSRQAMDVAKYFERIGFAVPTGTLTTNLETLQALIK
jgi:hypothetical protein